MNWVLVKLQGRGSWIDYWSHAQELLFPSEIACMLIQSDGSNLQSHQRSGWYRSASGVVGEGRIGIPWGVASRGHPSWPASWTGRTRSLDPLQSLRFIINLGSHVDAYYLLKLQRLPTKHQCKWKWNICHVMILMYRCWMVWSWRHPEAICWIQTSLQGLGTALWGRVELGVPLRFKLSYQKGWLFREFYRMLVPGPELQRSEFWTVQVA